MELEPEISGFEKIDDFGGFFPLVTVKDESARLERDGSSILSST